MDFVFSDHVHECSVLKCIVPLEHWGCSVRGTKHHNEKGYNEKSSCFDTFSFKTFILEDYAFSAKLKI